MCVSRCGRSGPACICMIHAASQPGTRYIQACATALMVTARVFQTVSYRLPTRGYLPTYLPASLPRTCPTANFHMGHASQHVPYYFPTSPHMSFILPPALSFIPPPARDIHSASCLVIQYCLLPCHSYCLQHETFIQPPALFVMLTYTPHVPCRAAVPHA